ncbi:unnamed protein product [Clonostachys rosea]|uniref:N-acetyltransferase domain-containing protein n=1 Tax=Bionectria ochroleuca TaxID=29856 RepID=A0ABY6U5Q8_BIOOC|nr:unnamed protein product [Clonostachys rosea]
MSSTLETAGNQRAATNSEANPSSNLPYVKSITAELNAGVSDAVIATCTAHLVERGDDRSYFEQRMKAAADATTELATDLFTSHGRLLAEHRSPTAAPYGTVDWGEALDSDDVLVFEHIKVAKAHRRKGVAKNLVGGIFDRAASDGVQLSVFVAPGALESEYGDYTGEERKRVIAEQLDICVQFWHSLGFRRVAQTNWLALKVTPGGVEAE